MDILFLMKSIHQKVLWQAQVATSSEELYASCRHLFYLEEEFLIPEMEEVAGAAFDHLLSQLLSKKIELMPQASRSDLLELNRKQISDYIQWQQLSLIPALREKIPTSIREDIGRAFEESLQAVT